MDPGRTPRAKRVARRFFDTTMIGAAARTSRLHTVSFWDALIIEAAQAAGAEELLSEDLQDGRRFGSLVLMNPPPAERGQGPGKAPVDPADRGGAMMRGSRRWWR